MLFYLSASCLFYRPVVAIVVYVHSSSAQFRFISVVLSDAPRRGGGRPS